MHEGSHARLSAQVQPALTLPPLCVLSPPPAQLAADVSDVDFVLQHLLESALNSAQVCGLHKGALRTLGTSLEALLAAEAPQSIRGIKHPLGPSPLTAAALQLKGGLQDTAGSLAPACTRLRAWAMQTAPDFPSRATAERLEGGQRLGGWAWWIGGTLGLVGWVVCTCRACRLLPRCPAPWPVCHRVPFAASHPHRTALCIPRPL